MSGYKTGTKIIKSVIQLAPFVMIGICAVLYFTKFRHVTAEQLLRYTPENVWLAAGFIIAMFSFKSLSFFFPMLVIVVASGKIFPNFAVSLIINSIGIFCMMNIPYLIGKFAEKEFVDKLVEKHKKMRQIQDIRMNNEVFFVYFLRAVNCLPYDVVSMFLGSSGVNWRTYILGSMLGTFPGMVLCTIMGYNADDPLSAGFIIPAAIDVTMSVISAAAYFIFLRRKKMQKAD